MLFLGSMAAPSQARFPDNLPPGWRAHLAHEKDKPYFQGLTQFLKQQHAARKPIFPPTPLVLRAMQNLDYDDVKVVILGQDPYHGAGQAIGLSFAVPNELRVKPPSLVNIFKEISSDLGVSMAGKGSDLSGWVEQGVLLLNTVLTVEASQAFSHRGKGWEHFTDQVIRELNERKKPVVFILWGAAAQKKKELITNRQHRWVESAHPSPLSASKGFFGCKHFSKVNALLKSFGEKPIDWTHTVSDSQRRENDKTF
jgi:uracil-DNA glycosylase